MMVKTEQLGDYRLSWPEGVFPLGGDTLALARFATLRPRWQVCDLGTGSGALLLLLAQRQRGLSLHGIDLDPLSAQTAQENLACNALPGTILTVDLRQKPFAAGQFDLVISNPPYFQVGAGKSGGQARCEEACTLDELCQAASRLTRNAGRFALCHRPERMVDILFSLRSHQLEPKRMQLVAHGPEHPPYLLLVEAVKQGRPGLEFVPQST